jgi:hypothetical protein
MAEHEEHMFIIVYSNTNLIKVFIKCCTALIHKKIILLSANIIKYKQKYNHFLFWRLGKSKFTYSSLDLNHLYLFLKSLHNLLDILIFEK